jgi:chromosome segregation ATPase
MARAGILYSDVAKAASLLVDSGKLPTVDTVRDAMGNTGSKSTIGPMLKRWKAEHQDAVAASDSGIPASLLVAVKSLYQHLQVDAEKKITQAHQHHQTELQVVHSHEQQLLNEKNLLVQANAAITAELKAAQQTLAKLQKEQQSLNMTLVARERDASGLQLRLMDRAAEVATLSQQLTLSRAQFDHYQEATAAQRTEEKQTYEQRIVRLEQELTEVHQRLFGQQSTIAQQETQISHLSIENARSLASSRENLEELSSLRTEKDHLSYKQKDLLLSNQALLSNLETLQQTLSESRMAQAAQKAQNTQLIERLNQSDSKLEKLDQERVAQIHEFADLQAQLSNRKNTGDASVV